MNQSSWNCDVQSSHLEDSNFGNGNPLDQRLSRGTVVSSGENGINPSVCSRTNALVKFETPTLINEYVGVCGAKSPVLAGSPGQTPSQTFRERPPHLDPKPRAPHFLYRAPGFPQISKTPRCRVMHRILCIIHSIYPLVPCPGTSGWAIPLQAKMASDLSKGKRNERF